MTLTEERTRTFVPNASRYMMSPEAIGIQARHYEWTHRDG